MADILVVDDDALLRLALTDRLRFWGHEASDAADAESALAVTAQRDVEVIFLDLGLPGLSGLQTLERWKTEEYGADVVVLTAQGSMDSAIAALRLGAADFLQKPADFDVIEQTLARVLERRRLQRVSEAWGERFSAERTGAVGESPVMRTLWETARRAAPARSTVLITGENGSGKQVLAEFVHRQSPRADGPFVYVNCVALSDELLESTLFGHEKGAFTGALARKPGRLEGAQGGTAFLDEIGDISPRVQAKLLHFLETGECERVGGTRTMHLDCRVLAATNRPLRDGVRDGWFREDLYYRLNVIELQVPPLRERREDIELLATTFLARFARELKRPTPHLAAATCEVLLGYAWPGNVRQLKNVMERLVVLGDGPVYGPEALPPELRTAPASSPGTAAAAELVPYREAVRAFKREYIARALAATGGNQTRAAALLGLQRTFLNKLLRDIDGEGDEEVTAGGG